MVHLITGYAGHGHVTAADDALYHAGVCGKEKYVMTTGTQFEATIENNNLITIGSGDLVDQGRHINIPTNSTESVTIENGTQGKTRIDLIVIRYKRDSSTGVESAEIAVLQGTPVITGQIPTRPVAKTGNLYEGDDVDEVPLYAVTITDITISEISKNFETITPLANIADLIYPVGSIYISTVLVNPEVFFGGKWKEIQGRFLLARNGSHQIGTMGGDEKVQLTQDEMPSHTHSGPSHTHSGPSHSHVVPSHDHSAGMGSAGGHRHSVARNKNAASGTARFAAQYKDGSTNHDTSWSGAHTHSIWVNGSGDITTKESGTGQTGASGTGQTGAAGWGKPHNNMPPYVTVCMWERIR